MTPSMMQHELCTLDALQAKCFLFRDDDPVVLDDDDDEDDYVLKVGVMAN